MLARMRKSLDENQKGFTLIELLVVVIIIGILAAIAIPMFLKQREKAWEKTVISDIRNATNAAEAFATSNNGKYSNGAVTIAGTFKAADNTAGTTKPLIDNGARISPDVTLTVAVTGTPVGVTYEIVGSHANLSSKSWKYVSGGEIVEQGAVTPPAGG